MSRGARREARERALSLLYEAEAKMVPPGEVLRGLASRPESFVVDLVSGVGENRQRIDALIESSAVGWDLKRMPVVDRNVLRLATYELLMSQDVPVGAVISEAVELVKEYSTDESGRFVNGVLATIAGEVRKPAGAPSGSDVGRPSG